MFKHLVLTERTAPLYAIQNYYKSNVLWNIFFEDYNAIRKTIKKINKISNTKYVHQLLNQIYFFESRFLNESLARLFFFSALDESYYSIIKTYLHFINRIPYNDIPEVKLSKIPYNNELLKHFQIIHNIKLQS